MRDPNPILSQAEAIARGAKRDEIDRLVRECERANDFTLRSLARLYRVLNYYPTL